MSRLSPLGVAIGLVALLGVTSCGGDRATLEVGRQIEHALARREMPDDAPWRDRRTQSLLRAFYKERRMRPAWTTGDGATGQAEKLSEALLHAEEEGLEPEDYSASDVARHLERKDGSLLAGHDAKKLAEFDLLCTIAAFHYMSDLRDGRISPKALDAIWVEKPAEGDLHAMLAEALQKNTVGDLLESLVPTQDGYRKLKEARVRYAKIVADGGWPSIPAGGPMRAGQRGPRVAALRARLAASGDFGAKGGDTFDRGLSDAVKRYQARMGRDPDGVVAATELAELNVPAELRLRQIELNMERWRWLPESFGERYLLVNIPEYMLRIYEGDRPALEMRVVVGKAMNQTPVFSDKMTQVVVNPTWNVPGSIARNEIVPAILEDENYLATNTMRVYDDSGKAIEARSVDWSDTSETERLVFRQDAGDQNPLGKIKFLFPNQFDVYLHDTPSGHLFAKEERSFSHGCVRVEKPLALAQYVLRGLPEADTSRVQELIAAGETKTIEVPEPLPVHIVYLTAFVDEHDAVGFREDVYGIDHDQILELRGRSRAQALQQRASR
ncbi:MAG TPA: L,D-transpeptidase family protein [Candidatus Eisenbacteria bacterium]|nr:L,D-transpeptidase family protein [Candidatus Eisenbacteria bacterium]